MLKKLNLNKYLLLFFFLSGFFVASPILAASLKDGFSTTGDLKDFANSANYTESHAPEYYVGLVLNGLFSILGIIAMGLLFYSGFVWMTARGNEAKVTKAKDNITEALIGLIILVGSYALTTFLIKIFT